MRNLLASTLLATGVPMLGGGDEFGRTQWGNNNAYCQDNDLSWYDWELAPWQRDLLETARFLSRLRRDTPALRQPPFFTGRDDPATRTLQMLLNGAWVGHESVLLVLHGGAEDAKVRLPAVPGLTAYQLLWDSAQERPGSAAAPVKPGPVPVGAASLQVYRAADAT